VRLAKSDMPVSKTKGGLRCSTCCGVEFLGSWARLVVGGDEEDRNKDEPAKERRASGRARRVRTGQKGAGECLLIPALGYGDVFERHVVVERGGKKTQGCSLAK
jgi:hypothetical protein